MRLKSILTAWLLLVITSLIYPGSQSNQPPHHPSSETPFEISMRRVYEQLNDSSLNRHAFQMAMQGHRSLTSKGLVAKDSLLTIIDFSRPSSDDRFYVIDLQSGSIVYKTLVAHGRNSGELFARSFSNKVQSHQSALGFYITGSPYKGSQGYSMLLNGVDTGFNDNARKRAIVIHGASYATHHYVEHYGRLGRSFGCPALPPNVNTPVINLIKEGSVVFGYYPDQDYLHRSCVLGTLAKDVSSGDSALYMSMKDAS